MGIIKRSNIPLADQFTQVPNAWIRDERLSYRARGVLAALLSHTEGFEVSENGLAARGGEGRDAIRKALAELRDHGYLTVVQGRSANGKLGQITWTITSPSDAPVAEKPLAVKPATGESDTKKTNSKNTNSKKTISCTTDPDGSVPSDSSTTDPDGSAHRETDSFSPAERADPVSPSFHNSKDRNFLLRGVQAIAQNRADGDEEKLEANIGKFAYALENFFETSDGGFWGEDYGWTDIPQKATSPYEAGKWLNTFLHAWKQDVGDLNWTPYTWSDDS